MGVGGSSQKAWTSFLEKINRQFFRLFVCIIGVPLTSNFLLEYSFEYLNEYSLISEVL